MRKGFTLVELLIVVVVLVTLMTITFRLGSIGQDQSRRNTTVARLQRLENCLSGYYAAFGTYPPVRLHGSRNYKLDVGLHGLQSLNDDEQQDLNWGWFDVNDHKVTNSENEKRDWRKVQAACKAQPVDCRFPFPSGSEDGSGGWKDYVAAVAEELKARAPTEEGLTEEQRQVFAAGFDDGISQNIGRHNQGKRLEEWRQVQLFKLGLMSFLLPRYLVMMGSQIDLYEEFSQWTGNNSLPRDPLTNQRFSWDTLQAKAISENESDLIHVSNIPSQAVTARWLPNLEGICECNRETKLFGITVSTENSKNGVPISFGLEVFAPSVGESGEESGGGTGGQYILDGITVLDGWDNEFYYYSPAPYQSYVLWSSGPNGRTFPPWVSRDTLNGNANACVGYWTEDDIRSMSH